MATISLRVYNREIESLIETGKLDQAIAHCQHILKTYSMHIGTYQLLGKAYLEAHRFAEAFHRITDLYNSSKTEISAKRHFRLYHPELSKMAGCVRVFSSKGGAECVDVSHGERVDLCFELTADGQKGWPSEKVFAHVCSALVEWDLFEVKSGHLEHGPSSLTVAAGYDGSVNIDEAPLLEESMDSHAQSISHPCHSAESVGSRPEMG